MRCPEAVLPEKETSQSDSGIWDKFGCLTTTRLKCDN